MIRKSQALSIAEASKHFEKEANINVFTKKFSIIDAKKAKELREKLNSLELIKLDNKSISKIIDFMPKNSEELNKILVETNLDEDETKKILDATKEFN